MKQDDTQTAETAAEGNSGPDTTPDNRPDAEPDATTRTGADSGDKSDSGPEPDSGENTPDRQNAGPETPASERQKSGLWKAVLLTALLVAASAGGGFYWWQQQNSNDLEQLIDTLRTQIEQQSAGLGRLQVQVEALGAETGQVDAIAVRLAERISLQERQIEELPLRISRLERAIDNLPNIDANARRGWMLAETAYYLRIANSQASLVGNTDVALKALQLADEKLRDLGDPALGPVRAVLSDEMTLLRGMPNPDIEGIVLTLQSLDGMLSTLPLKDSAPDRFGKDTGTSDDEDSGLDRAWRMIRQAFSSIVSVKPSEEAVTPLMSAEENALLVQGLSLELKMAQLALLRNETGAFRHSLSSVRSGLVRYFNSSAPSVSAALGTIDELMSAELVRDVPDISGSLTLLRQLGGEAVVP